MSSIQRINFTPNRDLLNPFFEGYKLLDSSLVQNEEIGRIDLLEAAKEGSALLDATSEYQLLAFKMELNSIWKGARNAFYYFDKDCSIWKVELGEEETIELFSSANIKDTPLATFDAACSISFPSPEKILIKRDRPFLELISMESKLSTSLILPNAMSNNPLLWIADSKMRSCEGGTYLNCLLIEIIDPQAGTIRIPALKLPNRQSIFLVHNLSFPLDDLGSDLVSEHASIISSYWSPSRPIFCKFSDAAPNPIIGSCIPFKPTHIETEPSLDLVAERIKFVQKWEQTKEDVTITISFFRPINGRDFDIKFDFATIRISYQDIALIENLLFDYIQVGDCTWSVSGCDLTVYLVKETAGREWITVFKENRYPTLDCEGTDEDFGSNQDLYEFTLSGFENGSVAWESSEQYFLGMDCEVAEHLPGIGIKNGDDALVFSFGDAPDGKPAAFHLSTYPALAFVQASKRDRRYILFTKNAAIIIESCANIYFYQRDAAEVPGNSGQLQRIINLPQQIVRLENKERILGASTLDGCKLILLTTSSIYIVEFPF